MSIFGNLRYKDFKYIWLSQLFSQIAINIITFALVLHIYQLTKSTTSISFVMIASALPVAIFGPFSGVLADKVNYRKIMIYTNSFRILTCLLLLISKNNVLGILEITFLMSALSQVFTPAESSSIPLVVPKEKIVSANSLAMTTTYATLLAGYSLSGPLMKLLGSSWVFVICGLLYVLATLSTAASSDFDKVKIAKKPTLENIARGITLVWSEFKDGIGYLKNAKDIFDPMIKLTVGWTALGAFITLLPAYGEDILNIHPEYIGPAIIAPAGLGLVISAAVFSKKKKFDGKKIMNKGFFISSISILIFSLYKFYGHLDIAFLLMLAAVIAMGYGSGMIQISGQTLLHLNSEEGTRGRVFAFSSMQLRLATTLPSVFVGAIADLTSPLITMTILALLLSCFTAYNRLVKSNHLKIEYSS